MRFFLSLLLLTLFGTAALAQPGPQPSPFSQNGSSILPLSSTSCLTFPSSVTGGCQGAGSINASGLYVNGVSVGSTATLLTGKIWIGSAENLPVAQTPSGDLSTTVGGVFTVNNLSHVTNSSLPNSGLANPATTVNGQSCVLGSTCTVTAAATSITAGSTTIGSGTDKGLLYDNAGTLGNLATANSGVLVTGGSGVPSISTTLPAVTGGAVLVTPTGATTAISLAARFAQQLSVKDFGAIGNGVANDTAAIQAAVDSVSSGAAVQIRVPPGTYLLNTNVTSNGRVVTWLIGSGAAFTGAGIITTSFGGYYATTPNLQNTYAFMSKGTAAAPVNNTDALDIAVKHTSAAGDGSTNNAASYRANYKYATSSGARVQAYFGEAIDTVGGGGSFSEGGRFHSIGAGGTVGALYGVIAQAQAYPGTLPKYVIGGEAVAIREDSVNAPVPASFDKDHYAAGWLSSSFGGDKTDVGFITNPYNIAPHRAGFMVAENSVDDTAFVNRAALVTMMANYASISTGIYTGTNSYAAILMLNGASSVIRVKNGAGSADHNVFSYSSGNSLVLGTDATTVSIPTALIYGGTTFTAAASGSGPLVGGTSPTFTGTMTAAIGNFSGPVKTGGYTVATLPAAPGQGATAYVTDAVACTFLAALTGGAATFCPVVYNGSAWVAG